ncbi:16S rRNA methyltransferase [Schaalia sp. 19OD2882]|uniref:transcription antitermination factor NusB n=1 Tax=Schaalia sp. 19OD2882 TaxID=2794089 RepID=UPI001C1EA96C|nr:transcription antitermination factor NusB [Schaalia sp. 19OD2882]QWW18692.1 16S rRNA methyltransferase [Schaalia sp. 19OD2882]
MATTGHSQGYRRIGQADHPRRLAHRVLTEVLREGAFANIALPRALRQARAEGLLDARDAAFVSELVYGTLRGLGRLDWTLARHVSRPLAELDPTVVDLLRMGAHQVLDMRVPDHAAVSATVDLARECVTDGPAKFVNAVLRSLTREDESTRVADMAAIEARFARLAVKHSHPQWMVEAFEEALRRHSGAADELEDLLAADNEAPLVTLVARPGLVDVADLADEAADLLGTRVAPGALSEYAVLMESGDPASLPSVRAGLAGAQDEGSQVAAMIAAGAPVEGQDRLWLDLCAGPGGKAALLAALAAPKGASLVANEVHPHRARLVERATRALDNVNVICADGRRLGGPGTAWPLGSFDRVVVDAPCSGMGSMRRRPESRWRRRPEDLDDLLALQADLLRRGLALTRPGGVLTYVTCSPHVAETLDQVAALLDEGGTQLLDTAAIARTVAVDEAPEIVGTEGPGGVGTTVQLWEHRHGSDLMFIACLRRR